MFYKCGKKGPVIKWSIREDEKSQKISRHFCFHLDHLIKTNQTLISPIISVILAESK